MSRTLWSTSVSLKGKTVELQPLTRAHLPGLIAAGSNRSIWKYMLYGDLTDPAAMADWVQKLLRLQEEGTDLPFVCIHSVSGEIVGATRYMEMRPEHKALEIGGTWYAVKYQGTKVNKEAKYLLLKYAFETLGCVRVQFKVDAMNVRSIGAIEKLGAVREGILRNQYIVPGGRHRDSVYFSILDQEWDTIKKRLEQKLENK